MKTILAFETSTSALSVALGTEEGRVREVHATGALQHSENLIPLTEQLLKKEKLSLNDINVFAIDRGPGSFTGLRIGFSLLKGFLAVEKRPCYGAVSLDMIAAKVRLPDDSRFGVLIDARREQIYSRFYRFRKGEFVAERKLELLTISELTSRVSSATALVGEALSRYSTKLKVSPLVPSARILVEWFQKRSPHLVPLKTSRDFIPLYFRASEAEEKRREKINRGV